MGKRGKVTGMVSSEWLSRWTASQVAGLVQDARNTIPLVSPEQAVPVLPDLDLWDMWPVQHVDGTTAQFDGWTLWMILSSPRLPDPEERHHVARIRLVMQKGAAWRDCGNLLPDGHCPGSREWAGSAIHDPASAKLTLFYTASGRRGEAQRTFEQRIFQTSGLLTFNEGRARVEGWSEPAECFVADDMDYVRVVQDFGLPGQIKAFRDPAHFRDPATGTDYLLFTGSLRQSDHAFNGAVGIARAVGAGLDRWELLPPLVSADTLNNELERPVMRYRDGRYYLFWSTQRKVFAPDGPSGPTGIYGMVADDLFGPYRPLNGSGLVAGNPEVEPMQTFSWWIADDLTAHGFIDYRGLESGSVIDDPEWRRAHFGGTPAPVFRIALDGDRAWIVGE